MKSFKYVFIFIVCIISLCNSVAQSNMLIKSDVFSTHCDVSTSRHKVDVDCNRGDYVLIFEDDFNGNTLDTTKWEAEETGRGRNDTCGWNGEKVYYTTQNVKVENSLLKIITDRDTAANRTYYHWAKNSWHPHTDTFEFISASIHSKSYFPIGGKFEARVKLPKNEGLFPAFWLHGQINSYNEIDIFELKQKERGKVHKYLNSNIFYGQSPHYSDAKSCSETLKKLNTYSELSSFEDEFHTYTLVWDKEKIQWYIDNRLIRTVARYYNRWSITPFPSWNFVIESVYCGHAQNGKKYYISESYPTEPMRIILNTSVFSEDDIKPTIDEIFPDEMQIDWVKVYRRVNCEKDIIYATIPHEYNIGCTDTNRYFYTTGKHINISHDVDVCSNHTTHACASESVIIDTNCSISSDSNSYFIADVRHCNHNKSIFIEKIPYGYTNQLEEDSTDSLSSTDSLFWVEDIVSIYPSLDYDGFIHVDFTDSNYSDFTISIENEKSEVKYNNTNITSNYFTIDTKDYELGEYIIRLRDLQDNIIEEFNMVLQ